MPSKRFYTFLFLAVHAALLLVSNPVLAHHGQAAYETGKTLTVQATMTEFDWTNPHCLLYFDVKDDRVTVHHWRTAVRPPTSLLKGEFQG
jgi:hypothetical protein